MFCLIVSAPTGSRPKLLCRGPSFASLLGLFNTKHGINGDSGVLTLTKQICAGAGFFSLLSEKRLLRQIPPILQSILDNGKGKCFFHIFNLFLLTISWEPHSSSSNWSSETGLEVTFERKIPRYLRIYLTWFEQLCGFQTLITSRKSQVSTFCDKIDCHLSQCWTTHCSSSPTSNTEIW